MHDIRFYAVASYRHKPVRPSPRSSTDLIRLIYMQYEIYLMLAFINTTTTTAVVTYFILLFNKFHFCETNLKINSKKRYIKFCTILSVFVSVHVHQFYAVNLRRVQHFLLRNELHVIEH